MRKKYSKFKDFLTNMRIESFSSMAGSSSVAAASSDGGFEEWSRGNCLYKCEACERPGKDKFDNLDFYFISFIDLISLNKRSKIVTQNKTSAAFCA